MNPQDPTTWLWDTKDHIRRNVRVMCDNAGMSIPDKNEMCATIHGESSWDIHAICHNYTTKHGVKVLASTDNGLCQWNDYWHSKEITPHEAQNDPHKSVSLMIQYWLGGQKDAWVAHKTGYYKQFLSIESIPSVAY